jgi:hypothetical protein
VRTTQTDPQHLLDRAQQRNAKATSARSRAPKDSVTEVVQLAPTTPEEEAAATRYITRRLAGTDASDLLAMLGLTETPAAPTPVARTTATGKHKGRCSVCDRLYGLRSDGTLVKHATAGKKIVQHGHCDGSNKPPKRPA